MMMNCFCGMVDRRKAFSRDHCQRSSPSRISDTPRAGFEPAQNLSSGFGEWSCTVVITTTPRRKRFNFTEFAGVLLQFGSSKHNCKTSSWRHLEDVWKTSWRRRLANTSWRRLEDVFRRRIANTSWRRLEDVLKTSWKTRNVCWETASHVFPWDHKNLAKRFEQIFPTQNTFFSVL